jgi:hypothetical protein
MQTGGYALMKSRTIRLIGLAVVLVIIATSVCGCGGSVAAAALKIAAVTALIDDATGSNNILVRVLADIISGNALKDAIALITKPDGGEVSIVLTLNEEGKYEGAYRDTDQATNDQYKVEVTATDTAGNAAVSETVTVDVPGAE